MKHRPALHDGILGQIDFDREKSFRQGKPANRLRCSKGDCSRGNACGCWHPFECPFHQKVNCKLGNKCPFKHTEKAGGEPKKRTNSVVVAKTLDHTQAEEGNHFAFFIAKGDLLH